MTKEKRIKQIISLAEDMKELLDKCEVLRNELNKEFKALDDSIIETTTDNDLILTITQRNITELMMSLSSATIRAEVIKEDLQGLNTDLI